MVQPVYFFQQRGLHQVVAPFASCDPADIRRIDSHLGGDTVVNPSIFRDQGRNQARTVSPTVAMSIAILCESHDRQDSSLSFSLTVAPMYASTVSFTPSSNRPGSAMGIVQKDMYPAIRYFRNSQECHRRPLHPTQRDGFTVLPDMAFRSFRKLMARHLNNGGKLGLAILCGVIVGAIAAGVHLATVPLERAVSLHVVIGDLVAALTTIAVCLAIQLRQEELHYRTAIERAAIVAELNHHIRNAVFPLCLAVQKVGDGEAVKAANDAMDRINLALRDATADALSGRVDYVDQDRNAA